MPSVSLRSETMNQGSLLLRAAGDGDVHGSEAVTLGPDQTDAFKQA
ncbi:MAG: hypothetical protein IPJ58_13570 [Ardenticatenia bacterium]|nr:hypothetical protein [Ardenticatenia bacterium]